MALSLSKWKNSSSLQKKLFNLQRCYASQINRKIEIYIPNPKKFNQDTLEEMSMFGTCNKMENDIASGFPSEKMVRELRLTPFTPHETKQLQRFELLNRGIHTRVVKGGRINSFSALMVGGDEKGTAGLGYGKGDSPARAFENARRDVYKNLVTIPRYEDRTIPSIITGKFIATKFFIKPEGEGVGIQATPRITAICECFGLQDITVKVQGSYNINNMSRGFIRLLEKGTYSPEDLALSLGKKLLNRNARWNPASKEIPGFIDYWIEDN